MRRQRQETDETGRLEKVVIPLLTLVVGAIVALAGNALGVYTQHLSNEASRQMTTEQLTFNARHQSYVAFMTLLPNTYHAALNKDATTVAANFDRIFNAYYVIAPMLKKQDRDDLHQWIFRFKGACEGWQTEVSLKDDFGTRRRKTINRYMPFENHFRDWLPPLLFPALQQ